MRLDKPTTNTGGAAGSAGTGSPTLATAGDGEHLALVSAQQDGIIPTLLQRTGVDLAKFQADLAAENWALGQGAGHQLRRLYLSPELKQAMDAAQTEATRLATNSSARNTCHSACWPRAATRLAAYLSPTTSGARDLLDALGQVRGNQRVTDANPEDKFQFEKSDGQDLTALAKRKN